MIDGVVLDLRAPAAPGRIFLLELAKTSMLAESFFLFLFHSKRTSCTRWSTDSGGVDRRQQRSPEIPPGRHSSLALWDMFDISQHPICIIVGNITAVALE